MSQHKRKSNRTIFEKKYEHKYSIKKYSKNGTALGPDVPQMLHNFHFENNDCKIRTQEIIQITKHKRT